MTIIVTVENNSIENPYCIFINKIPFKASSMTPFFIAVLQTKVDGDVKWFTENTFEGCLADVKNYLHLKNHKIKSIDQVFNIDEEMEIFRGRESVLLNS